MDFLRKDLVRTFSYTNMNDYRSMEHQVVINGRTYLKLGQSQAVTLVGNLYKCWDPSVKSYKYMLMVGVAKQHPCDYDITEKEGYAIANEHAYSSPSIVMEVSKDFNKEKFCYLSMCYIEMMHLSFVKTKKEIKEKNCCN